MRRRTRFAGLAALTVTIGLALPAAAVGAVRYAEPGVGGANPACPQADPCDIEEAVEMAAVGDEVVILSGTYSISDPLSISGADTVVHGEAGQPRPVIETSAGNGVFMTNIFATLRNVEVRHTGGSAGLTTDGTTERVVVRSSTATACRSSAGTIRDSTCWTSAGSGPALDIVESGAFAVTSRLRNVTAVSTGSFGLIARALAGQDLTVEAKSVIARGGAGVDVQAQTDSSVGTTSTIMLTNSNYATAAAVGAGTSVTAAGTGTNQTAAPMFMNAAAGDFHQAAGSRTINAGATDSQSGTSDIDGEPRTQGSAPDIGADEFDQIAPSVSINSGPGEGETIATASATFEFTASETSSFECELDGAGFGPCSGPGGSHSIAGLANGPHSFSVRATDVSGNTGAAASRSFTVAVPDTDPPETEITKGPPNRTEKERARFKFRADEPGSTFRCKIDKKPFKPCASPRRYRRLDEAKHKFLVRATDPAGNTDPTPDKDKWKVLD